MCNKSGSYAVHKFSQEIVVKDIEESSNETNKGYDTQEEIHGLGLNSIAKIGLIILVMYKFKLLLNQDNLFKPY